MDNDDEQQGVHATGLGTHAPGSFLCRSRFGWHVMRSLSMLLLMADRRDKGRHVGAGCPRLEELEQE